MSSKIKDFEEIEKEVLKEFDKKGSIVLTIIFIFPMILAIILLCFSVYYNFLFENECLEIKAEEICNNNNMSNYEGGFYWELGFEFYCKEDEHLLEGESFIFTKKELKECGVKK